MREGRTSVELAGESEVAVTQVEKNKLKRGLRKGDPPTQTTYISTQTFGFDGVYWLDQSTADIYLNEVASLVDAVLDGTTACLFAYGQTGSGKTFTLTGCPKKRGAAGPGGAAAVGEEAAGDAGIMQMAAQQLMARVEAHNRAAAAAEAAAARRGGARTAEAAVASAQLHVYVTAGEIYQEALLDLGEVGGSKPKKLTATTLRRIPIASASAEELVDTMEALIDRRAAGATNKNEHSSRSHAVYSIHVARRFRASPAEAVALYESDPRLTFAPAPGEPRGGAGAGYVSIPLGCLGLVDLAGAEYASATEGCDDKRRVEGSKNNLGLMTLKAAFRHLGDLAARAAAGAKPPPPFSWHRSSLTRILRPFFCTPGGRLMMLVTASPEAQDASQTAQAMEEGTIIAGRPVPERIVVDVGPSAAGALASAALAGGKLTAATVAAAAEAMAAAAAAAALLGPKKAILRAGSGGGGGKARTAVPAAGLAPSASSRSLPGAATDGPAYGYSAAYAAAAAAGASAAPASGYGSAAAACAASAASAMAGGAGIGARASALPSARGARVVAVGEAPHAYASGAPAGRASIPSGLSRASIPGPAWRPSEEKPAPAPSSARRVSSGGIVRPASSLSQRSDSVVYAAASRGIGVGGGAGTASPAASLGVASARSLGERDAPVRTAPPARAPAPTAVAAAAAAPLSGRRSAYGSPAAAAGGGVADANAEYAPAPRRSAAPFARASEMPPSVTVSRDASRVGPVSDVKPPAAGPPKSRWGTVKPSSRCSWMDPQPEDEEGGADADAGAGLYGSAPGAARGGMLSQAPAGRPGAPAGGSYGPAPAPTRGGSRGSILAHWE
jgi:hypothetical protein